MEAACGRKELSNARKVIPFQLGFGILFSMETVVHIRFYANMRRITGQVSLDVAHSSANTVSELLARLVELFPDIKHNVLDKDGNLRRDVPIFVNGRNPRLASEGINMPLDPDDVMSLFSPIFSGRLNVEVMRPPAFEEQE